MLTLRLIGAGTAVMLLTACGGFQQSPSATPAVLPAHAQGARAGSSDSLIYAVAATNHVYVFPDRSGTVRQTLSVASATGACSDSAGDVFITALGKKNSTYSGIIYEYAHGGAAPIATLYESSGSPYSCSVDAKTGNLAVANDSNAAVFAGAQGTPTYYPVKGLSGIKSCTHDASGDLFIIGDGAGSKIGVAELQQGHDRFVKVAFPRGDPQPGTNQSIHYYGNLLITLSFPGTGSRISEDTFTVSGTTAFAQCYCNLVAKRHKRFEALQPSWPWLGNSGVVASSDPQNSGIGFWNGYDAHNVSKMVQTRERQLIAFTVSP